MGLKKILGIKEKTKEELIFVDEDLTVEKISEKMSKLSWDDAANYVRKLSPSKSHKLISYELRELSEHYRKENEKCLREPGRRYYDYHDLEHPACNCD